MAKRKSVVNRIDTLARKIVRLRDGRCQCPECKGNGTKLEVAHVAITRKYYISRWDLINLLLMCDKCHNKFDANHAWGMTWFAVKYPVRTSYLAGLEVLKNSPEERTRTWRDCDLIEIEDKLKEKLKEMEI